ncbi:HEPN domain-containing protein [Coprococcus eutactus]|uniref:HEPN domain-containing protein n=1 Tax=Clostridia TaxID=186801 RepID=UPI0003368672|nr:MULTISPECIES: HEPN domain-containing protein [Clostridia]RHV79103.1 HEPN domain-containing protein [Clostridium sp. OF10-22XD]CCY61126.1 hEPN domain protein [Clostridium sp. CAG:264]SCI03710.1 HEPN domain [uncultured Coprococcus sp.]MCB5505677.1 HEPN domain-containing protein [Coprococcus eutactus]MCU6731195.1 HEPN domain-containing protein [Coprococcus ammoniilyticus]
MDERQKNLSNYRIAEAEDSLKVAAHCLKEGLYKDSINRSYYAAFYAVKAILALSTVDFKRHKDVMGYFNKEYVAKEIFPREIGRKLGTLQRVREKSDYDDFYIASREKAEEQFQTAELVIGEVKKYLDK